ncbi:MAG: Bug family tripartite tricarboxylate transporter substrate binding protein [Burkholderiaceae bacterium]|jgi:tripartite-type tricarboxylate transporter receptor subunit TctC
MKRLLTVMLSALLCAVASAPVGAQDFPSRPLRIIVPYPPGGGTDRVARIIGEKLAEQMGQPVVIDNRAGAGGVVGTEASARAAPDGYTMVLGSTATHAVNPSLYSKPGYDPIADFVAISPLATTPAILVVNASLQVSSLQDLLAMIRTPRPGVSVTFASAGAGSLQHMAGELFKSMTKADILHVPYKGAAPAMTDLLAGHVTMAFDTMPSAMPHVRAGKLKALGISAPKRVPSLPDVPAIAEVVPGYELITWYGLLAPRGVPAPIVERLNGEVRKALESRDVADKLNQAGLDPMWSGTAEFAAMVRSDVPRMRQLIQASGAKAD